MGEANLSAPFITGAGVCDRQTPQCGTRCCIHVTKSAWGGMGSSSQGTSPEGSALCRARPAQHGSRGWSWTPLRPLGLVLQQGLGCPQTIARDPSSLRYPWQLLFLQGVLLSSCRPGNTVRSDPRNLLFSPCAVPPEDQLRQGNTFCCL